MAGNVCPLSLAASVATVCHVGCKLNDNGKCLLAEALKKLAE